jgi:hypothetical protein
MRWSKKVYPDLGDTRTGAGFLFIPVMLGSETRWLEWAVWREQYTVVSDIVIDGEIVALTGWEKTNWVQD